MSRMTNLIAALTCAAVLVLSTCAAKTKLGDSWTDPDYSNGPIKKILVVGVTAKEQRRQVFEDQFTRMFHTAGIAAEPSHELIPNVEKLTREIVESAIGGKGFDTVIVTRIIDADANYNRSPGGLNAYPVTGFYNSLYGYYGQAWTIVRAPDYVEYKEIYSLETNIYALSTEKLIWTVQSQAVKKLSAHEAIKTFTTKIIQRLKKDGIY